MNFAVRTASGRTELNKVCLSELTNDDLPTSFSAANSFSARPFAILPVAADGTARQPAWYSGGELLTTDLWVHAPDKCTLGGKLF